jgi:hypothetical protein
MLSDYQYLMVNIERFMREKDRKCIMNDVKNINKKISEIKLINEKPNLLICNDYEDKESIDFENIYGTVRIIIINYELLGENNYQRIPENVEIIMANKYENKRYYWSEINGKLIIYRREEKEMIEFMKEETLNNYIKKNILNDEIIIENNKNGNSVINEICKRGKKEILEKIINERRGENIINKWIERNENIKKIYNYKENEIIYIILENIEKKYIEDEIKNICNYMLEKMDKYSRYNILLMMIEREEKIIKKIEIKIIEEIMKETIKNIKY